MNAAAPVEANRSTRLRPSIPQPRGIKCFLGAVISRIFLPGSWNGVYWFDEAREIVESRVSMGWHVGAFLTSCVASSNVAAAAPARTSSASRTQWHVVESGVVCEFSA